MRVLLTVTFPCIMLPSALLPPGLAPKNPSAVLTPPALEVRPCDLGSHAENAQNTFRLPLCKEMQEGNPELSQSNSAVPVRCGAERRGLQSPSQAVGSSDEKSAARFLPTTAASEGISRCLSFPRGLVKVFREGPNVYTTRWRGCDLTGNISALPLQLTGARLLHYSCAAGAISLDMNLLPHTGGEHLPGTAHGVCYEF